MRLFAVNTPDAHLSVFAVNRKNDHGQYIVWALNRDWLNGKARELEDNVIRKIEGPMTHSKDIKRFMMSLLSRFAFDKVAIRSDSLPLFFSFMR